MNMQSESTAHLPVEELTVHQIKVELSSYGVSYVNCVEKSELIALLRETRKNKPQSSQSNDNSTSTNNNATQSKVITIQLKSYSYSLNHNEQYFFFVFLFLFSQKKIEKQNLVLV
jgi:hypothetical protein